MRSFEKEVWERFSNLDSEIEVGSLGELRFGPRVYPLLYVYAPARYDSAGIVSLGGVDHGDEEAGLHVLFNFFKSHVAQYRDNLDFLAFACMNPSGYEANTRFNLDGLDINRSFLDDTRSQEVKLIKSFMESDASRYDLFVDLHEDPTDWSVPADSVDSIREFYLYETGQRSRVGPSIIKGLEKYSIPVCRKPFIYGDPSDDGVIWCKGVEMLRNWDGNTSNDFMHRYSPKTLTIETPTCWPLETRVNAQLMALKCAIDELPSLR